MVLRRLALPFVAVLLLAAGCGEKSSHQDPATALKRAAQALDRTSGVQLSISATELPDGVEGLKSASGTVTDAPAFDGTLGVVTRLGSFSVPVKSVGGKVYAQIPLTPGWSEVDPSDYGAPDPAQLISADNGVQSILAATQDPKSGKDVRGGADHQEVLSTITGKVPGSAVAAIIPGASGDAFDATYGVTSGGELRQVRLTGMFYDGHPATSYTLVLTGYGTAEDVTAP
jgi:lipoprotein LprG